jgi:hypothetical protein
MTAPSYTSVRSHANSSAVLTRAVTKRPALSRCTSNKAETRRRIGKSQVWLVAEENSAVVGYAYAWLFTPGLPIAGRSKYRSILPKAPGAAESGKLCCGPFWIVSSNPDSSTLSQASRFLIRVAWPCSSHSGSKKSRTGSRLDSSWARGTTWVGGNSSYDTERAATAIAYCVNRLPTSSGVRPAERVSDSVARIRGTLVPIG